MNCDQALVRIVEADLTVLQGDDTPLARHVQACERCAAVVRMLERETGALTFLFASVPLAVPTGDTARARPRTPHVLRWVSLAAASAGLLYVFLLRPSASSPVPFAVLSSDPREAAPPPPASPAPPSVAAIANRAVATRPPRQDSLPSTLLRAMPPDAVPIPLSAPIAAERTVPEPTIAVPASFANDAVLPDSSAASEQGAVARHPIALPQSNPRVTVLWLSPSPSRPLP